MCTNIGLTGSSADPFGKVLIGGVSDDPYDIRTRVVVERSAHAYAFIGTELKALSDSVSMPGYNASVAGWPTRALNEKGLAYTWTFAHEKPENAAPADAYKSSTAWAEIMRHCATIDEAIVMLRDMKRDFSGNFMLADSAGNLAVVEAGRKPLTVTQRRSMAEGGSAIAVNCWLAQADEGLPMASVNNRDVPNYSRYRRSIDLLEATQNHGGFAELAAMLRDHGFRDRFAGENPLTPGHGYSICNHGTLGGDHFSGQRPAHGSVSAEIVDPVDGIFWYAYGWPCGEAPEAGDQLLQERSWGAFIGFPLATLPAGIYTTLEGELTPLAAVHFGCLIPEERPSQGAMSATNWRRPVGVGKGPTLRA
jgi:Acyl-coenzyme A:6-aminopenicillanic acid acyl-transferase